MIKESSTITFREFETAEEALAIVRYDEKSVHLCLSLKSDGDIEVSMNKEDAKKLVQALTKAITG